MTSKGEIVQYLDKVVLSRLSSTDFFEQFCLNLCTISIMLLALAHLNGNDAAMLLVVETLDHAAESTAAHDCLDLVSVV